MTPRFLALVGPTAAGKTEAAIAIAERLGAEIVSVDSMLLYRGMDVGTAKPTAEQRARVPHHLIDIAEAGEDLSVSTFQRRAGEAVAGIRARDCLPLLVGGSGLYFRAIVDGLEFPGTDPAIRAQLEGEAERVGAVAMHRRLADVDPVAAQRIQPANVRRTVRALEVSTLTRRPFSSFAGDWQTFDPGAVRVAGVEVPRDELARRIEERVRRMYADGLVEEVRALRARDALRRGTSAQAIGYAEAARLLDGDLDLEGAIATTVKRTRELARRQLVWFRRDPRIRWFDAPAGAEPIADAIADFLAA